jgi:hypothetical protein
MSLVAELNAPERMEFANENVDGAIAITPARFRVRGARSGSAAVCVGSESASQFSANTRFSDQVHSPRQMASIVRLHPDASCVSGCE